MQPDAEKGEIRQLVDYINTVQFSCKQLLAFMQEAQHYLNEGKLDEADIEIARALEVIRGLNK